jgi:hypothetical protein
MRIYGTNRTATARSTAGARRAVGSGFSVSGQENARQSAATGSLRAVSTLDALLALQGAEDFTARKKRAVAKGRKALDALDGLKTSLLDGSVDRATLARLKVAAEGLTDETGDGGLDAVLHEINLRVAVELAKAGLR